MFWVMAEATGASSSTLIVRLLAVVAMPSLTLTPRAMLRTSSPACWRGPIGPESLTEWLPSSAMVAAGFQPAGAADEGLLPLLTVR